MKKLNEEQKKWMKNIFCLSKKDFPTDFCEPKDFLKIICGEDLSFRGLHYAGDSMSFVDDCFMSLTFNEKNKEKFELIWSQLNNYWIKEALENEYYELLCNLTELKENFLEFGKRAKGAEIDLQIKIILHDLNIDTQ